MLNIKDALKKDAAPSVTPINSGFARVETLGKRLPDIIDNLMLHPKIGKKSWVRLAELRRNLQEGGALEPLEYFRNPHSSAWKQLNKSLVNWRVSNFIDLEYYFYLKILELTGYWFQVELKEKIDKEQFEGKSPEVQHNLLYKHFIRCKGYKPLSPNREIKDIDPYFNAKNFSFKQANDTWEVMKNNCQTIENLPLSQHSQKVDQILTLLINNAVTGNLGDLSQRKVNRDQFIKNKISKGPKWCWDDRGQLKKVILNIIPDKENVDQYIDYITDNSQSEFIADIQLIYFFVIVLKIKVRIWIRTIPVFVSDILYTDVKNFQSYIKNKHNSDSQFQAIDRMSACLNDTTKIEFITHPDMDTPKCFHHFADDAKELWKNSKLIIIKGDLNYRKLVEDRHWQPKTSICKDKDYQHIPIFALRAVKSETIVNIKPNAGDIEKENIPIDLEWVKNRLSDAVDDENDTPFPIMVQQF